MIKNEASRRKCPGGPREILALAGAILQEIRPPTTLNSLQRSQMQICVNCNEFHIGNGRQPWRTQLRGMLKEAAPPKVSHVDFRPFLICLYVHLGWKTVCYPMPTLLLSLSPFLLTSNCYAAPAIRSANGSQKPTYVGYVSDPDGRGTSSLVLSCLLTLLLCVWSALHLNVPPRNQTRAQCIWTNIRWIFVGVYAPELVCFAAWRQWSSARILGQSIRDLTNASEPPSGPEKPTTVQREEKSQKSSAKIHALSTSNRKYAWTKTHDFFASTGGFAIEISNERSAKGLLFIPECCPKRMTLTARGVQLLAKCGVLPDVAQEDILDKSKANGMAKALVVLQALWMLLQVLGRIAVHLPVTLLEVNTVAHV